MATHMSRRPKIPGGQPRKLYPYVTAKQRKSGIAPHMEAMIRTNTAALEKDGNTPGKLNKANRLSHRKASGGYKGQWQSAMAKNVSKFRRKKGGSMHAAKIALTVPHQVSFGADPKSK